MLLQTVTNSNQVTLFLLDVCGNVETSPEKDSDVCVMRTHETADALCEHMKRPMRFVNT